MVYFGAMPENASLFAKLLISWYLENKRHLPWRTTSHPYAIWLSEIILQQTRVAQGLPYYLRFLKEFPTVHHLAAASEAEVLKLWQGLGYYSRARNLHATAKYVSEELEGNFPQSYNDLLKLKGVGDYTASAIASICYSEARAVVDGNVYRVLARVFDLELPINSPEGKREFKVLAQDLIDVSRPGTYNQALMEFGATFCVPQNPDCAHCIFKNICLAHKQKKVHRLPVKRKSAAVKNRYFNYLVVLSPSEGTLLKQRLSKGIWQKLYEFPLIETAEAIDETQLKTHPEYREWAKKLNIDSVYLYNDQPIVHKLSHQHLDTRFWIVETTADHSEFVPVSQVKDYAVPVLIENFVSEFFSTY